MIEKIDREMALLKNTLDRLQQEMIPNKKYIKRTVLMFEDLVEYNRNVDGLTKNKILCYIFDGKLVLENGRVAATPFSASVQILLNITKGFHRSEKRRSNLTSFLNWLPLIHKVATG